MTTWALIIKTPDDHTSYITGDASDLAAAAAALVRATAEQIKGAPAPARYTLSIDNDAVATLVSTADETGSPDNATTVELLERINLVEIVAPATSSEVLMPDQLTQTAPPSAT